MTTASPERSRKDPKPSEDLHTQKGLRITKPTSSLSDATQIQDHDAENDERGAQNDAERAKRQGQGGGPRTKKGKEAAARRSTKHGILSSNPVIPGVEDPRDWQAHLEGVCEDLEPVGHLEQQFARRVAMALWQLARLDRHVAAVTAGAIENAGRDETVALPVPYGLEDLVDLGQTGRTGGSSKPVEDGPSSARIRDERIIPRKGELKKIIRYEAHLHRVIDRNLRALEALQSKRLGVKVYLHRQL